MQMISGKSLASRTNDSLVDNKFASYILASSLVKDETALPLGDYLPYSGQIDSKYSFARIESFSKTNHLTTAPDCQTVFYIDKKFRIIGCPSSSGSEARIRVLSAPVSTPELRAHCSRTEETSLIVSELLEILGSSLRIFVASDGHGNLAIFGQFGADSVAELTPIVSNFRPHDGKSFILLDCSLEASGIITIATRAIEEAESVAPALNRSGVEFVSEKMDVDSSVDDPMSPSSSSAAPDEKELQYRAPARLLQQKETKFTIGIHQFIPKTRSDNVADPNGVDLYQLSGQDFFVSRKDIHALLLDYGSNVDRFIVVSDSMVKTQEQWNESRNEVQHRPQDDPDAMDQDSVENDDLKIDDSLLETLRGRLSAYTSDKVETNPLSFWQPAPSLLRDEDSYISTSSTSDIPPIDDEETAQDSVDAGIFVFTRSPASAGSPRWTCSYHIPILSHPIILVQHKGGPSPSVDLGLGIDIHARIFNISFSNQHGESPIEVVEVRAFEALNFIQQGKRNKKFLILDASRINLGLIEHAKFLYVYRKIDSLPGVPAHKSVHQLVEKRDHSFLGAQWIPNSNTMCILCEDQLQFFTIAEK